MNPYLSENKDLYFLFPVDGDVVNEYDGDICADGLLCTEVYISAPEGRNITVNNVSAVWNDNVYTAKIRIHPGRNSLEATDHLTQSTSVITVYRFTEATGKYRISLDDNILFLKDINDHKDEYTSIFDNPYLSVFKKAHDLYGACIHANIYWEFDKLSAEDFSVQKDYFNLSMMTDKFKNEFINNSSWLKLSFHAASNYPDDPYKNSDYESISAHIKKVNAEIVRFAGKESLAEVTTLHWGSSNPVCAAALRDRGYKALAGIFETSENGDTIVAYHYPYDLVKHIGERDFWVDTVNDIICARIDVVLNSFNSNTIVPKLAEISKEPHRFGFLSMLMHEQYFYSDYKNYIPDFEDIILNACKYAVETGHKGSLIGDVVLK